MSRLVLVRHGQAEAFSEQPDRLTALGWEQGRALGRHWRECGLRVDAAFHGTLRRQRETFDAVRGAFRAAGVAFPRATVEPGLDEYAAQDLVRTIGPQLARAEADFALLWERWVAAASAPDRNRHFQRMFENLAGRWSRGEISHPGLEPWSDFRSRANAALSRIRAGHKRGARVVAFTSGGPIGVAVQSCLGAPPEAALAINWRVRNCSLTSFLFSGSRVSLDAFNEMPHFAANPELVSFR